jgi:TonB family protein
MPLRKLWSLLLLAASAMMSLASVDGRSLRVVSDQPSLAVREHRVRTSAVHNSAFGAVSRTTARINCEFVQPPQALATPDPLLDVPYPISKVTVSFIVGTDGRVHNPLILKSAGLSKNRTVLDAMRSWRFRPAMCNGVPTEAEGKIEFSSR